MLEALLERCRQKDRRALSRLLSHVSRGGGVTDILDRIGSPTKASRVVAVTGSAGVGKSTLVGKMIEHLRGLGRTVSVLACDPQSPRSGGALLGDRFRMPAQPDDGVFIRSLATAGSRGAVAEHIDAMFRLLECFGFDVILVETVGAGQGDTTVHELADVVLLMLQPETGDDLQWEKAGLMEVADVIAVHKADLPGADRVEMQVKSALGMSGSQTIPVLRVSSKTGENVDRLWSFVEACPLRRQANDADGRALLRLARESLAARFDEATVSAQSDLTQLVALWQEGSLGSAEAVSALLRLLAAR